MRRGAQQSPACGLAGSALPPSTEVVDEDDGSPKCATDDELHPRFRPSLAPHTRHTICAHGSSVGSGSRFLSTHVIAFS